MSAAITRPANTPPPLWIQMNKQMRERWEKEVEFRIRAIKAGKVPARMRALARETDRLGR